MIERHDPAIVWRVLVRADTESTTERSGERRQEAAGDAGPRCRTGQRRPGPVLTRVPPGRGGVLADCRQDPGPSAGRDAPGPIVTWCDQAAVLRAVTGAAARRALRVGTQAQRRGELPAFGPGRAVIPVQYAVVALEHARGDQALVVAGSGHEVADPEVPRTDPLAPRHPVWGQQGIRARQQYNLADGHGLRAGCARHRHRPAPALVCLVLAAEQVGNHALIVSHDADVLADLADAS